MKESILHYVWQNRLYVTDGLVTDKQERVEVIDPGRYNTDAGPDFFNAKIKIGSTLWAGNVEIHVQSSDWKKHNHQLDKAYDSVILHVVGCVDESTFRTDGTEIPQLQIVCSPHLVSEYEHLMQNSLWVPCADKIGEVPSLFIRAWKEALLTERLEQKLHLVEYLLSVTQNHWEEAFYVTLARSFGFGTNSQAFEQLALSLPLTVLAKHKDQLFQLEALLFGQSGLLDKAEGIYAGELLREYEFLKVKYDLRPISATQWKLLRLRPDNFPTLRIAQFAALVHSSVKLLSRILDDPSANHVRALFACEPSDYWKTHYLFGAECKRQNHRLGHQSVDSILINTVVPFLFCFASQKGNEKLMENTLQLLESIPSENNAVIRGWSLLGIESKSAYDSQALLQLKKQYCDEKKCLRCRVGHKVLSAKKQADIL